MRTVYVQELMRLPLGKQGENGAARIVWQGLAARYQALYGAGVFTLTAKRCGDAAAYPVAVSTEGGDVVWLVQAADVASPGSGSCELTYTVDGAVAKSQTWSTYVAASISGDAPGEPPEEPARAWFAAVQAQMGNLDDLTTKAKANLVAAINEAARTGSGGGADIDLGITGASAGQAAKVKAVDSDGKPTAWEPTDLPSGEGEKTWTKIIDVEITEPTREFRVNDLNGATEIHIRWSNLQNASQMNSGLSLEINGKQIGAVGIAGMVQKNGTTAYGWTHCKYNGLFWIPEVSNGALSASNTTKMILSSVYNLVENVGPANSIHLGTPTNEYAPIMGKLEVWAR